MVWENWKPNDQKLWHNTMVFVSWSFEPQMKNLHNYEIFVLNYDFIILNSLNHAWTVSQNVECSRNYGIKLFSSNNICDHIQSNKNKIP